MATPRALTHFCFMLSDEGERAIHLATAPSALDQQPHLVLTIRPDQTVTFYRGPALSLADLKLVVELAADYPAANTWLSYHSPRWFTGEWHPLPAVEHQPQS